ncbi:sensor domain-containing phosphodiesterase [Aureimonas phyllosphaerae]|uniref:EAL domain-containing protein (Putative c-di-GMP-specific phosphodiesterase class I) n=1 Tax=Aureimonas phyllosphaerae TaxID=1166078 RepID=A0A7W6FUN5_9HYPH|nr:EAL domain-containing protein [Aureimonas phyllosphaerae]MBB3936271.1 EAL domain-containing protein (putative c-di-GMP-specific phosphodiesterase class I) [Aureimonas phyllosphaerae]MBB3960004.1 EAL domain-containing protein (putative c-di-GMP-specific phosphodiesterase class I) [Aureimonas phyllosphaerae]SFF47562.1 EAL domain, c-di-GMP-specific phosphodiesterase class I (or its enzymatically inactive variant) [Aureimonas phyllosphaerae]
MQRHDMPQSVDGFLDIRAMLRLVRQNLGLDIAFIGEFVGGRRVFRHVDADAPVLLREGDSDLLEETYCGGVVEGRLPELMPDTARVAEAARLPVTRTLPIGSHLSVPIRLSNGMVYGTFCCFGHAPDHSLNQRDLAVMRTFAGLVAQRVDRDLQAESLLAAKRARIRRLLDDGGPTIVFQPVFLMDGLVPVGAEALSRFPADPHRSVETWFTDAAEVGLQIEMEHRAIANALDAYAPVWARHRVQLGLNASPAAILAPGFLDLLAGTPADRLVLEVTEHERIDDYADLLAALGRLRERGVRIAIDDVGAGYSSMSRVVAIRPDIIKLDREIVHGLDTDLMRQALARALVDFAERCGCKVVAEGVETPGELAVLSELKVQGLQGYLLGRPAGVDAMERVLAQGARRFEAMADAG